MNLGRFTHRVVIQKNRPTVDDEANCVERWDTIAELYADITPISSREYLLADQHASEITHKIYIRYNSIVDPRCRILHQGHVYEIDSVLPDAKQTYMTIMAREVI